MNGIALFTDASLNHHLKRGVGALLFVPASPLTDAPNSITRSSIARKLKTRRFYDTSSTKLEVETVLWALENFRNEFVISKPGQLHVYSDSQCVAGLPERRTELEFKGFYSKGKKKRLKNASLYSKFYELYDELGFEVIKVTGHSPSCSHDTAQRIFSFIDREVRKSLRLLIRDFEHDSIE